MRRRQREQEPEFKDHLADTAESDLVGPAIGLLGSAETDEFSLPGMLLKDITADQFYDIEQYVQNGSAFFATLTYSDVANGYIYTSQEFVDTQKIKRAMHSLERNPSEYGVGTLVFRENSKGKEVVEVIITDGNHRTAISLLRRKPIRILIANTWNLRDNTSSENPNDSNIILGFNHIVKQVRRLIDVD